MYLRAILISEEIIIILSNYFSYQYKKTTYFQYSKKFGKAKQTYTP